MRYFISLSYRGSAYSGWQVQVNRPSVQAEIERAFSIYLGTVIGITGAGRTDAGVHATGYIAHFDSPNPILAQDYPKLIYKINAILPADITLFDIFHVPDDAHARFDAISRTYKYYIHTKKDSFASEFSYFFPYDINLDAMNLAASYLLGEKDFTSMAKLHSDVKTNICTVTEAFWTPGSPLCFSSAFMSGNVGAKTLPTSSGLPFEQSYEINYDPVLSSALPLPQDTAFCFTISANRFLRNMVRAVVGSLLDVGRGKQQPESIKEILAAKNRSSAGISAPAHALFLTRVEYP